MSATFVLVCGGPFFWDGTRWAGNIDTAVEYQTKAAAEKQMRRLGAPGRRAITRAHGKRLVRAAEKESNA